MLSSERLKDVELSLNTRDSVKDIIGDDSDTVIIDSRFGQISVDVAKSVYFPKGLYGFPENLHFGIVNFPADSDTLQSFKVLQCLNDHSISIPVLPSGFHNQFIDKADMQQCLETIEVKEENFAMLFIVSSKDNKDGTFSVSINTKAPIVMDVSLQTAIQYIFTNNKYSTNFMIGN